MEGVLQDNDGTRKCDKVGNTVSSLPPYSTGATTIALF